MTTFSDRHHASLRRAICKPPAPRLKAPQRERIRQTSTWQTDTAKAIATHLFKSPKFAASPAAWEWLTSSVWFVWSRETFRYPPPAADLENIRTNDSLSPHISFIVYIFTITDVLCFEAERPTDNQTACLKGRGDLPPGRKCFWTTSIEDVLFPIKFAPANNTRLNTFLPSVITFRFSVNSANHNALRKTGNSVPCRRRA